MITNNGILLSTRKININNNQGKIMENKMIFDKDSIKRLRLLSAEKRDEINSIMDLYDFCGSRW